jgi:hypothetical protein
MGVKLRPVLVVGEFVVEGVEGVRVAVTCFPTWIERGLEHFNLKRDLPSRRQQEGLTADCRESIAAGERNVVASGLRIVHRIHGGLES